VPLSTPALKLFAIGLIVGTVLVAASAVRSVAELAFADTLWLQIGRRRMEKCIAEMADHVIVCGYGRMGRGVVAELEGEGVPLVVVECDAELVAELAAAGRSVVIGDASRDEPLRRAGIERARALIAVAGSDAVNVLIVLSAKFLNPKLRVAARAEFPDAPEKLLRAGADYVLQPHGSGATHLALAVNHPVVEDVLNRLLPRHGEMDLRQVVLAPGGRLAGRSLAAAAQDVGAVLVLAILRGGELMLPPQPSMPLRSGDILVVVGSAPAVQRFEALA
jgi:voltage-gated potassium channel